MGATSKQPILYRKTCGLASINVCCAQHVDKRSDRPTRLSERSEGCCLECCGYSLPMPVPPAFRRSMHRLDTRGQLPIRDTSTWQRVCMPFRVRRALVRVDRIASGAATRCCFQTRSLLSSWFSIHYLKPYPSSWRLRTPPHASGRGKCWWPGRLPKVPKVAPACQLLLHHGREGRKRGKNRKCVCVREMQEA